MCDCAGYPMCDCAGFVQVLKVTNIAITFQGTVESGQAGMGQAGFCSKRDTIFCLLNLICIQVTMLKRDFALSGTV
jgi:hypothetical protein